MDCVILAGGLGTRMRPTTQVVPKALIPVNGRPFIDLQLEWLRAEGVKRVVLSIGYKGTLLRDHVGDGGQFGLDVEYVDEGAELRGTGGALRLALERGALPESFLVLYGDSYLSVALGPVWEAFAASGQDALMTVLRNEGRWDRSNVRYADGWILLYDKSGTGSEDLQYIDYGLSVLSRRLVEEEIPLAFFDLAVLFNRLSRAGRLAGYEVQDRFYEVGSPSGLAELQTYLRSGSGPGG
jgi:MurNAc alpha-1-phosphate uridylyltransferase